ncbi:MAG: anti-sigma factor family protein [Cytophagaceae bacterium]
MNFRDNIHEWIDRYLNGQMDGEEKSEFESLLATDADFAKTFEIQKITHEIVVNKALLGLKAQIDKDLSKGLDNVGRSNNFWKFFGFGAVVITAILIYCLLPKERIEQVNNDPEQEIKLKEASATETTPVYEIESNLIAEPALIEAKSDASANRTTAKENICSEAVINFSCQARGACAERNDGAIEIDANTIKAGKAPFAYSLSKDGEFQTEPVISNLKPGRYMLFVKDSKNCVRQLNVKVEVPEINCEKMLN